MKRADIVTLNACIYTTVLILIPASYELCPDPYTDHSNGACLYLSDTQATWQESRERCQELDGDLAKVDNPDIADICDNLVLGREQSIYWLGLNDILLENRWVWPDGEDLQFSLFTTNQTVAHYNQPNGGRAQNCALQQSDGVQGWQDKACHLEYLSFCQYKEIKSIATLSMERLSSTSVENVEIFETLKVKGKTQCVGLCNNRNVCDAIAYNSTTYDCLLLNMTEGVATVDPLILQSDVYLLHGH